MNLEETYQRIIQEIDQGHRGFTRFHQNDLDELQSLLVSSLKESNFDKLEKVLCLIEHSSSLNNKFEPGIIEVLKAKVPDLITIFGLNCARKHIIEARFQKGQRLDYTFLEAIRPLLQSKNPEVVEWTLRLIEGCGNQGVYFLKDFDKIKPPPWKWFNSHQRAVREIIALLERRWSPLERPKS